MIHIVFNEPDIKVLEEAIAMDEQLAGEVIQVKDDFAVGPLQDIHEPAGMEARKQWWRDVLAGGDYEGKADEENMDDHARMQVLADRLREDDDLQAWIWIAPNKHDISGYYWLLYHLKEFQGRVMILNLANLPFFNEKGHIFYPEWLSQIPPKEFLKAKKLAREITLSEFEVDPDEWTKICAAGKGVRLLEGGKKLAQEDYDFYDAELKKYITADWQKASKIIHHFLSKAKHTTGDAYLLWRLKVMTAQDMFDMQGKTGNMKDFELKIKNNQV